VGVDVVRLFGDGLRQPAGAAVAADAEADFILAHAVLGKLDREVEHRLPEDRFGGIASAVVVAGVAIDGIRVVIRLLAGRLVFGFDAIVPACALEQQLLGERSLVKAFPGFGRVVVAARVPFHRHPAVRQFDFFLGRRVVDAEDVVRIHGGLDGCEWNSSHRQQV
jgi:hypothetical protein